MGVATVSAAGTVITEPKKTVNWYAGKQYDVDVGDSKA